MICLENVSKDYVIGEKPLHALRNVNLNIQSGEFIAITGPSGAGKSTLMSIIGCLDIPSSGRYLLNKQTIDFNNDKSVAHLRSQYFGFVFQSFNLIPRLDIIENVELPMVYAGVHSALRRKRALAALKAVGLDDMSNRHPSQLSGGQQQRVAIARALVNNPPVIVADEPTGNLDPNKSGEIIELFEIMNRGGKTILYVTHDQSLVRHAKRIITVTNGEVFEVSNAAS